MGRRKKYADQTEVANQQMEAASGYPVQDKQNPFDAPSLDETPKDVEDSDRELTKEKFPEPAAPEEKPAADAALVAENDDEDEDDEDDEGDEDDDDEEASTEPVIDDAPDDPETEQPADGEPVPEEQPATDEAPQKEPLIGMEAEQQQQPQKRRAKATEFLRYDFNQDEMSRLSRDLALSIRKRDQAQNALKAAQAQFKQQIEAETATTNLLANQVAMGYEMRNIDCVVYFHTPEAGRKQIVRTDTGELVREEKMRRDEMQDQLFDEEPKDQNAVIKDYFKAA